MGSPVASSFRELNDRSLSRRPSIDTLEEVDEAHRDEAPPGSSRSRTRGRRARFSLTSVSNALIDAVRSGSPKERTSKERADSTRRGRPREKAAREDGGVATERPPLTIIAGLKSSDDGKEKEKEKSDSWKEFKKGARLHFCYFPSLNVLQGHTPSRSRLPSPRTRRRRWSVHTELSCGGSRRMCTAQARLRLVCMPCARSWSSLRRWKTTRRRRRPLSSSGTGSSSCSI